MTSLMPVPLTLRDAVVLCYAVGALLALDVLVRAAIGGYASAGISGLDIAVAIVATLGLMHLRRDARSSAQ